MCVCVCVCHNFTSIVSIYSARTRTSAESFILLKEKSAHILLGFIAVVAIVVLLLLLLLVLLLLGVIICFGLLGSFTPEQKNKTHTK